MISEVWARSFLLTCELAAFAVGLAFVLGVPAGWAAARLGTSVGSQRSSRFFGSVVRTVFLGTIAAVLALPLVMHAAAWEAAAGKFGWWTLTQTGSRRFGQFSGLIASAWIHGLHGSAIV